MLAPLNVMAVAMTLITRLGQKSPHGGTYNLLKPGERKEAKVRVKLDPEKDYTTTPLCLTVPYYWLSAKRWIQTCWKQEQKR